MSDHLFAYERVVVTTPAIASNFFREGRAWYRLNPEWEVLAHADERLSVRYERSEVERSWRINSTFAAMQGTITLTGEETRRIEIGWQPCGEQAVRFEYRERFAHPLEKERLAELHWWCEASAGYLALAARQDWWARLGRWLLDRIWLQMSPTARRITMLILAMEALAFLLFLVLVLALRFFS